MARRPLQLLAALALVSGILGVSTSLIDEVHEQVVNAQPPEPRIQFRPPEDPSSGLPVRAFTLLDPAPATLPNRDQALQRITLTGNGTLHLGEGDAIELAPMTLPAAATARFPQGATVDGSTIHCRVACVLETPVRTLDTLPNATLTLPPDATVPGRLEPGASTSVPAGTEISLGPLVMPSPTEMPLLPGASIQLPDGATPLPAPDEARNVRLPADTIVRGQGNGSATREDLSNLLGAPGGAIPDDQLIRPQRPSIEVTSVPSSIEKGRSFPVAGTVHLPNGTPSRDHPVTVYANATKRTPGFEIQIGAVRTNDEGRFTATARIEEDRPARPYHIVARAHPLLQGPQVLDEAWSDPIVPVNATAHLTLDAPAREGIQVPLVVRAQLTDEHGAPVPNRTVTATIQGSGWVQQSVTGPDGYTTFVARDGLSSPGTWTVTARFDGTEHVTSAAASANVEAVRSRILTDPTLVIPRGTNATIDGRVLEEDQGADRVRVSATLDSLTTSTLTQQDGSFTLELPVPADARVGNETMQVRAEGTAATRTIVATITGRTELSLNPPDALPLGGVLPLTVNATSETGHPLAGVHVNARVGDGATRQSVSDGAGIARVPVPLQEPGPVDLTVSTPGTPLYAGTSHTIEIDPSPLSVAGDLVATLGAPTNATLRLHAGETPLRDEPVRLVGAGVNVYGRTDDTGRARLPLSAPAGETPGTHQARLELPRFGIARSVALTVLDTPRLEVTVDDPGREGRPIQLTVTATGSRGPLPEVPITAETAGAFEAEARAVTDPNGAAHVSIPRPEDARGETTVTVRAEQTPRTARAQTTTATVVSPAPFPWWTLAAALPVAGAVAAYAWHRRGRRTGSSTTGPRIRLRLTEQPPGAPPVWHPGQTPTLEIALENRDGRRLTDRVLSIEGPRGRRTLTTNADGTARLRLPSHDRGLHAYTVRFEGDRDHAAAQTTLELRIVDYREEIDREYRQLRERAAAHGLCGPDATPRELARALGGSDTATRLARLFERCDYSPHPVNRSHYVRFMRAKEACGP